MSGTRFARLGTVAGNVKRFRRSRDFVGWMAILVELAIVLPPVALYFNGRQARARQRQYQAWQVIGDAQGHGWSSVVVVALEDLNEGGFTLRAVNLSNAPVGALNLPNADLKHARMVRADLPGSDLHGARMARTDLRGVNLEGANLRDAEFAFANAGGARFDDAALCGALLIGADLRRASFRGARLRDVRFDGADLRGAVFDLDSIPAGSSFRDANITGLRAPDSFVEQARTAGARAYAQASWNAYRESHELDLRKRWVEQDLPRSRRGRDRRRDCR
ncbi:MAG TPA: pentapeptide repeat-containing protein [Longimicrobium sp.]